MAPLPPVEKASAGNPQQAGASSTPCAIGGSRVGVVQSKQGVVAVCAVLIRSADVSFSESSYSSAATLFFHQI